MRIDRTGCVAAGVARLLREYEEISARALKLGKLWEPSPFPLETGGE
ncbi:MAG: hypothetical protein ABWZ80_02525 [Beijerinckiaceae bacterium]